MTIEIYEADPECGATLGEPVWTGTLEEFRAANPEYEQTMEEWGGMLRNSGEMFVGGGAAQLFILRKVDQ